MHTRLLLTSVNMLDYCVDTIAICNVRKYEVN